MTVFALVAILVWGGMHAYLAVRLLGSLSLSRRGRWLAALGVAILVAAQVLALWRERSAGAAVVPALSFALYLYIGLVLILFPLVAARDLVWAVVHAGRSLAGLLSRRRPRRRDAEDRETLDAARRRFLLRSTNAGIAGASVLLGGVGVASARGRPTVFEVDVPIADLPPELQGYRIAQVSDLHVGTTIRRGHVERVVAMVNELGPDLVAITGDLVDGHPADLLPELGSLRELVSRDGTYFVTGNHEYYWDAEAWCRALRSELGLLVLTNEHRVVERGEARLLVAGVTDHSAGRYLPDEASDPRRALAGAPPCDARLLLAHQPRSARAAAEAGFDLQLSGHTHGGQFFPWTLFVGLVQPFVAGLDRLGSMWVYVNRGTGYWGPPLRIGSPPEITLLRLVAAS